jgi:hypothetical protein
LENTSSSIITLKAIRDDSNKIMDLEYMFINSQGLESMDRKALVGKRMRSEFPEVEKTGCLKNISRL